jgi:hypothetical protein
VFSIYRMSYTTLGAGVAQWYSAGLRAGRLGFLVSAGTWNFSLHHRLRTGYGAHISSYTMGTRGLFPEAKAAGAWSWPLSPSSAETKNAWSYTSISLYVFITWYLRVQTWICYNAILLFTSLSTSSYVNNTKLTTVYFKNMFLLFSWTKTDHKEPVSALLLSRVRLGTTCTLNRYSASRLLAFVIIHTASKSDSFKVAHHVDVKLCFVFSSHRRENLISHIHRVFSMALSAN